MALIDRMRVIQADLRQKQAYIDARPERIREWSEALSCLYDVLEDYLSVEREQGYCTFMRQGVDLRSDDLGSYNAPALNIFIERQLFVMSKPRKSDGNFPDLVDMTKPGLEYIVRIAYFDGGQQEGWVISAGSDSENLLRAQSQWLSEQNFKSSLEPFFRVPSH